MALRVITLSLNIPSAWDEFLLDFQRAAAPDACIVGGALRDTFLGKKVKDIDIVAPWSLAARNTAVRCLQMRPVFPESYGEPFSDPHLAFVDEAAYLNTPDTPVQILWTTGLHTLEDHLNRLDFGICQIGYDGREVVCTEAFVKDVANRTFTLTSRHSVERSLKRFERLQAKYPDYTLVA